MSERSARREVLNQARRKVERALALEGATQDLAAAAEQFLSAGEAAPAEREALRAALERYRRMRDA
jgi:alkylhydroperoxidase/carboxymuconolactone decarboxylase family protein YurZ